MSRAIFWIAVPLVAACTSSVTVVQTSPDLYTATATMRNLITDELIPARRLAYERAAEECRKTGKELLVVGQSFRQRGQTGLVAGGTDANLTFKCVSS